MNQDKKKKVLIYGSFIAGILTIALVVATLNLPDSKKGTKENNLHSNLLEKMDLHYEEKDIENKEYAYKSIMGQESPMLHENMLSEYSEGVEQAISKTTERRTPLTNEEEIKKFEEETGREFHVIEDKSNGLVINQMFDHIFDNQFRKDETEIDIDKQYALTLQIENNAANAKELEKEVEKFITSSFSWSHENKNNKEGFLAYRVGEYFYGDRMYTAMELYEKIHKKIKDKELSIDVKFDSDNTKVYIHPNGGYIIDKDITLTFNQNDEKFGIEKNKDYTFTYRAEFSYNTPTEKDVWYLWNDTTGAILTLSSDLIHKDLHEGR